MHLRQAAALLVQRKQLLTQLQPGSHCQAKDVKNTCTVTQVDEGCALLTAAAHAVCVNLCTTPHGAADNLGQTRAARNSCPYFCILVVQILLWP